MKEAISYFYSDGIKNDSFWVYYCIEDDTRYRKIRSFDELENIVSKYEGKKWNTIYNNIIAVEIGIENEDVYLSVVISAKNGEIITEDLFQLDVNWNDDFIIGPYKIPFKEVLDEYSILCETGEMQGGLKLEYF